MWLNCYTTFPVAEQYLLTIFSKNNIFYHAIESFLCVTLESNALRNSCLPRATTVYLEKRQFHTGGLQSPQARE